MLYRAIAQGITVDGHPIQGFAQGLEQIHDWAHVIANRYNCHVLIFQTYERKIKRIGPTKGKSSKKQFGEVKERA